MCTAVECKSDKWVQVRLYNFNSIRQETGIRPALYSVLLQALSLAILMLYRYGGSPGWDKTMWMITNTTSIGHGGVNSDREFFFGATANGMFLLLLVQTIGAIGGDKSFFTVSLFM